MINRLYSKMQNYFVQKVLQKAQNKGLLQRRQIVILLSLANTGDLICNICGHPIRDLKQISCDHIIPTSRGGDRWNVKNYQLSHKKCNFSKGNKNVMS